MTQSWERLATLTINQAQECAKDNGDSVLAKLLCERLEEGGGKGRSAAWSALPLVVRLRTDGTSIKALQRYPPRVLELAPPHPDLKRVGRHGSHVLLDTILKRLLVVLYDWDTLELSPTMLDQAGLPGEDLLNLLKKGKRPADEDAPARWQLEPHEDLEPHKDVVRIRTGVLDGSVSPVVGHLHLGSVTIDKGDYAVEVLALPRLSDRARRSGRTVDLHQGDEPPETSNLTFLAKTTWATGTPANLMGLLRLAHDTELRLGDETVRLASDDDPSPLAWIALANALEQAAEQQRRQYTRRAEVRRTPVGTVQMSCWMTHLARRRPDLVPVVRFSLSPDNLENRLFRGVAQQLARRLRSTGALGQWLAHRFERVEAAFNKATLVEPELWMCESLLQRALPPPIERAVRQCEAALAGRYPGLSLHASALLTAPTFEIDLAGLFEAAIRQLMRDVVGEHGLEVVDGNTEPLKHALRWTCHSCEEGGSNRLKPDLALRPRWGGPNRPVVALGDAKYKRPRQPGDSSYSPLSRADFQQLMTYMLAWPSARWGIVLMPWEEASPSGGPASHMRQELRLPDGRVLGVFQFSAARWGRWPRTSEPLVRWVEAKVTEGRPQETSP